MDIDRVEIYRVVNFQIKNMMKKLKYLEFGIDRKFYEPGSTAQAEVLRGDFILNIMKGYKTTMDIYENSVPKLMIDCCCRIVREYDLWQEIQWYKDAKNMPLDRILDKFVIGRSFLTTYGNQRIYRIEEVELKMTPMSKFPNEKFKTFYDYFEKQYKVKIQNKSQFLVVAIRKKKIIDANGKKIEVRE